LPTCLRDWLSIKKRQKSRDWYAFAGDFEFDQATLAALSGDGGAAIDWLSRAIDRGWLGLPCSSSLADRPQCDALRTDSRLAALPARIDRRVAEQRSKALAARQAS